MNQKNEQIQPETIERSKQVLVIFNPKAGNQSLEWREINLATAFEQAGFKAVFKSLIGLDASLFEAQHLADFDTVVVVGGDGTVRTVAGYLVGKSIPLAIMPAGTFNHLAKDLNIPLDVNSCLALIKSGFTKCIDIAEVNGYYFLNNSSIGLYPKAVKYRNKFKALTKWLAMTIALVNIIRQFPTFNVNYYFDNKKAEIITPLVFISNNLYRFDLLNLSERQILDAGKLYLYINHTHSRLKFFKLLFDIFLHKREKVLGFFAIQPAETCTLTLKKRIVEVAIDGELIRIETPLQYRIHSRRLTVISPE